MKRLVILLIFCLTWTTSTFAQIDYDSPFVEKEVKVIDTLAVLNQIVRPQKYKMVFIPDTIQTASNVRSFLDSVSVIMKESYRSLTKIQQGSNLSLQDSHSFLLVEMLTYAHTFEKIQNQSSPKLIIRTIKESARKYKQEFLLFCNQIEDYKSQDDSCLFKIYEDSILAVFLEEKIPYWFHHDLSDKLTDLLEYNTVIEDNEDYNEALLLDSALHSNNLPKKTIKLEIPNPDYNEWHWLDTYSADSPCYEDEDDYDMDIMNWRRVEQQYPIKDLYWIEKAHPNYKVRGYVVLFDQYTRYSESFNRHQYDTYSIGGAAAYNSKEELCAVSLHGVMCNGSLDIVCKNLVYTYDYLNNKYDVNKESADVKKEIEAYIGYKDEIYNSQRHSEIATRYLNQLSLDHKDDKISSERIDGLSFLYTVLHKNLRYRITISFFEYQSNKVSFKVDRFEVKDLSNNETQMKSEHIPLEKFTEANNDIIDQWFRNRK